MVLKVDSDYKNNIKHYKPSLMLYLYEKKLQFSLLNCLNYIPPPLFLYYE